MPELGKYQDELSFSALRAKKYKDAKIKVFAYPDERDAYADEIKGQIYTLVDTFNGSKTGWSKGKRVVNRLNHWMVLVLPNHEEPNNE